MTKEFSYKEIKETISYFRFFLNKLQKCASETTRVATEITKEITALHATDFFSNFAQNHLHGKAQDENIGQISNLLHAIYHYMHIKEASLRCAELYAQHGESIKKLLESAASISNPVSRLFASKNKKARAEEAFSELYSLKSSTLPEIANNAFLVLDTFKAPETQTLFNDFRQNNTSYKNIVNEVHPQSFSVGLPPMEAQALFSSYQQACSQLAIIENSLTDIETEIKTSVEHLIAEELVN